jgi:hypothetical protein
VSVASPSVSAVSLSSAVEGGVCRFRRVGSVNERDRRRWTNWDSESKHYLWRGAQGWLGWWSRRAFCGFERFLRLGMGGSSSGVAYAYGVNAGGRGRSAARTGGEEAGEAEEVAADLFMFI